jgi:hypothetical protein
MSMTTDETKLIENSFAQYCSMHELAALKPNFPKHLIHDMEDFLSKQIPFNVDKLSYVFSTQHRDYAHYQIPFAEKVLHAHEHLEEVMPYYTSGSLGGSYESHHHWFIEKILSLPKKERLKLYEKNILEPMREYALESLQKRIPSLDVNDVASFYGQTIYKNNAEKLGVQFNFITYFIIYGQDKLVSNYDQTQTDLGKKLTNQLIKDYQVLKQLTFSELKEKYAFSCLMLTKNHVGPKFRNVARFFNIDFKEEKQYQSVYLSYLQNSVKQNRSTDVQFINTFLSHQFNYDDKNLDGVSVRTILWGRLNNFITHSMQISSSKSDYNVEVVSKKINDLFDQLEKWQTQGLDLKYLLELRLQKKESKTHTITELFEHHIANIIAQNKQYSSVEVEKVLFEATSRCRTLISPIAEGKKIKL